jgi:hypothetical protein
MMSGVNPAVLAVTDASMKNHVRAPSCSPQAYWA